MPNVTEIKTEPDKTAADLERLRRNSGAVVEYHLIMADIRYQAYRGYLKAGFTEAQALELVKQV